MPTPNHDKLIADAKKAGKVHMTPLEGTLPRVNGTAGSAEERQAVALERIAAAIETFVKKS